jgi:glutamyl-tRNA reductase
VKYENLPLCQENKMVKHFTVITLHHRVASLLQIGRFVLADQTPEALISLQQQLGVDELVYLTTCNRVFLGIYSTQKRTDKDWHEVLSSVFEQALAADISQVEVLRGQDAISHVFKMASSIESLVPGEREIFRQLKEAFERCRLAQITGDHWRILMQSVVVAAKDVYTNSQIGRKQVSVVSVAFAEFRLKNPDTEAQIWLVGAGQTNGTLAKLLHKKGYKNVRIFNRSLDKAVALAALYGWQGHGLDELNIVEADFDVLVACTSANEPLITLAWMQQYCSFLDKKRIFVDLSVPANIDIAIKDCPNVKLIDIEQLRARIESHLTIRRESLVEAIAILEPHINGFEQLLYDRRVERALSEVPSRVSNVRSELIPKKFKKQLDTLDPATRVLIDEMLLYMEKQCVGIPLLVAKKAVKVG